MLRFLTRLALVLTIPFIASEVQAQALIHPFGNLAWNDSFTSVVLKMKNLPGIEKGEISGVGFNNYDLMKEYTAEELSQIPGNLAKSGFAKPMEAIHTDLKTGKQWRYAKGEHSIKITVYPVLIETIPFAMTAHFQLNGGLFLYKPENLMQTEDGVMLPYVLRSVRLASNSPALATKAPAITAIISQKYFGGKAIAASASLVDKTGTRLSVSSSKSMYSIEYGSLYGSGFYQKLQKDYGAYSEKTAGILAEKNSQGKQDLSGVL